ncbi:MAG TPA: type II secretion system F family protein [Tepidisphaeraceae bacterium]|jgi:type II secretory pathway component PulF|nr:type II secretion system F family protein [Tepidisphaeraceae bacterium]
MSESPDPQRSPPPASASPVLEASLANFSYTAQTEHGFRLNGSIEAPDHATAIRILEGMRLRVVEVFAEKTRQLKTVRDDEFVLFNRRLAQLTNSGLPIEDGLRLIAGAMRRGRFAGAIAKIAAQLKNGVPLTEAFDAHRKVFPPLYGLLLDAGTRGGNLPGVVLNLGRHLELRQRLRGAMWRSISYPIVTFCGLLLVTGCIGLVVMPQIKALLDGFHVDEMPVMLDAMIWFGAVAPWLAAGMGGAVAIFAVARLIFRAFMLSTATTDGDAREVFDFLHRYYDGRFSRTAAVLRAALLPLVAIAGGIIVREVALGVFQPLTALMNRLAGQH